VLVERAGARATGTREWWTELRTESGHGRSGSSPNDGDGPADVRGSGGRSTWSTIFHRTDGLIELAGLDRVSDPPA